MEIHVYIGNKSNGFACETLGQILVYIEENQPPVPLTLFWIQVLYAQDQHCPRALGYLILHKRAL